MAVKFIKDVNADNSTVLATLPYSARGTTFDVLSLKQQTEGETINLYRARYTGSQIVTYDGIAFKTGDTIEWDFLAVIN